MKKGIAVIAFALLLMFSLPAMAYNFTASDFTTHVVVKINGNAYSVNKVNGTYVVDHVCFGHELVSIIYTVTPVQPQEILNKKFIVKSETLLNPLLTVYPYYRNTEGNVVPIKGYISPENPNTPMPNGKYTVGPILQGFENNEGPTKIVFIVNGTLPVINKPFENLTVFELYIENGSKNCFPPVVVRIINKDKLSSYVSSLKSQISKLEEKAKGCKDAEDYLSKARNDITAAESVLNSPHPDYYTVYVDTISAEGWLKKAEVALNRTTAENIVNEIKTKIDLLSFKIQQIEGDLYKVGSKVSSTQLAEYLNEKSDLKQKYEQYSDKLNDLQKQLNSGNYTVVINQGKQLLNEVNATLNSADTLLSTLEGILSPAANETATATPTPTPTPASPIKFSTTTLEIIAGAVAAVIIIAVILYMRGRGGFDELR